MAIYETDLPGVGKKFEVDLDDESQLVIVIHNTGKRELFLRDHPDADSEKLVEFSDQLARQVGTIMEGAYFQPIQSERIATAIDEDSMLEWVRVPEESPLVGQSLQEANIRQTVGASIIAIQRDEDTLPNPDPTTVVEAGDTLVTIGTREAHRELERLAAGDHPDA